MKQKKMWIAVAVVCGVLVCCLIGVSAFADSGAQTQDTDAAKLVEDIATYQAFTDEQVSKADMESIVLAGVNAPSAMNAQPWHFSVITDAAVLKEIADGMRMGMPSGGKAGDSAPKADGKDMPAPPAVSTASGAKAGISDAPMVVIISCKEGKELDAGLAAQNMSVEAQLLGYATKLISSPTIALNGEKQAEYKALLEIPEDMTAVCMLLVGKADTKEFDAVSGATARNDVADVVSYIGFN